MISLFLTAFLITLYFLRRRGIKTFSIFEKYGNELHIAYGVLVGKLFTIDDIPAWLASLMLSTGYFVYQIADYIENRDTISKDIAVFLASVSGVLTLHYGISIPV